MPAATENRIPAWPAWIIAARRDSFGEVSPPQDRFYGAESLALLDSAIAHVLAGDLTSAAERLEPVFSLAPDKRVELICQRSTELQRAVERFGRTERGPMAALVDHIPDFLSAAG